MSAELAVMCASLWGSLLEIVQHNANRQQNYLRFFETGLRFHHGKQEPVLSLIWAGGAYEEQWGEKKREVDFFDLKNTLDYLHTNFRYQAASHPALHPAQSAEIFRDTISVGFCGALHPEIQKSMDIKLPVFMAEIIVSALTEKTVPYFTALSKFPIIRRDIALVIDSVVNITIDIITKFIQQTAGNLLQEIKIFDVYQKSNIAIGLIFQSPDRTLVETDITVLMEKIITGLKEKYNIVLRE